MESAQARHSVAPSEYMLVAPASLVTAAEVENLSGISPEEARLIARMQHVADEVGGPIVKATSIEALDVLVEMAILEAGMSKWLRIVEDAARSGLTGRLLDSGRDLSLSERVRATPLGRNCGDLITVGDLVAGLIVDFLRPHADTLRQEVTVRTDGLDVNELRTYLSDPTIPAEVASAVEGIFHAHVCFLALEHLVRQSLDFEKSLARHLAGRWVKGLQGYLGLLVSIQMSECRSDPYVPERLLPREYLFDLAAAERQAEKVRLGIAEMNRRADAEGGLVYAPFEHLAGSR